MILMISDSGICPERALKALASDVRAIAASLTVPGCASEMQSHPGYDYFEPWLRKYILFCEFVFIIFSVSRFPLHSIAISFFQPNKCSSCCYFSILSIIANSINNIIYLFMFTFVCENICLYVWTEQNLTGWSAWRVYDYLYEMIVIKRRKNEYPIVAIIQHLMRISEGIRGYNRNHIIICLNGILWCNCNLSGSASLKGFPMELITWQSKDKDPCPASSLVVSFDIFAMQFRVPEDAVNVSL